jgi:dihydropteroate synthase
VRGPHDHPRLGRPALALGARALGGEDERAALALDPAGLDGPARRWLAEHATTLTEDAGGLRVRLDARRLAGVADDSPALAALDAAWRAWREPLPEPELMAILNATPDSFSDGGLHLDPDEAVRAGLRFAAEGARWLDVGGESTRPGAPEVSPAEELARVLPVIEGLAAAGCPRISIDTRRAEVAEAALAAGATMVNDVGAGLDDPRMPEVVAAAGCDYVLMHRQGDPATMQVAPRYDDVLAEVARFLRERAAACLAAGVAEERLLVDPGIGFGKRLEHNLDLLARLGELRSLGLPLLVGPSRKSFIAHVTGLQREADWRAEARRDDPRDRLGGTAAAITFCVAAGARVLRIHDVAVLSEAAAVARALRERPSPLDPAPCSSPTFSPGRSRS